MIKSVPTPSLKPIRTTSCDRRQPMPAAQSYWQELFDNEKLSPLEYKYLFPDLSNSENETIKEVLTCRLTTEMNLMLQTDWDGCDAVGLTAFWLKVLSEPKVPQLRQCKQDFITKIVETLHQTDNLQSNSTTDCNANGRGPVQSPVVPEMNVQRELNFSLASLNARSPAANIKSEMDSLNTSADVTSDIPPASDQSSMWESSNEYEDSESLRYDAEGKPVEMDISDQESSSQWTVVPGLKETLFSCKICAYNSPYKSRIKQHMRSVHSSFKPFKCPECDHTTAVRASLTKHINAVHNHKLKSSTPNASHNDSDTRSSLETSLTGSQEKKFKHMCPHCEYGASARNVLDIHIQAVHLKEKPYKCPECPYRTSYPQYIPKHHAAVHQKSKPFACTECDYRSASKSYLQKHCDAVHNNIKPYSCPQCTYTTSYPQYLTKHISAVHNDEKPFKCPICDFRCAYKQYISKHLELVHNISKNSTSSKYSIDDSLSKFEQDVKPVNLANQQSSPASDRQVSQHVWPGMFTDYQ